MKNKQFSALLFAIMLFFVLPIVAGDPATVGEEKNSGAASSSSSVAVSAATTAMRPDVVPAQGPVSSGVKNALGSAGEGENPNSFRLSRVTDTQLAEVASVLAETNGDAGIDAQDIVLPLESSGPVTAWEGENPNASSSSSATSPNTVPSTDVSTAFAQGVVHMRNSKFEEARNCFEQAMSSSDLQTKEMAHLHLGELCVLDGKGKLPTAKKYFEEVEKSSNPALVALSKLRLGELYLLQVKLDLSKKEVPEAKLKERLRKAEQYCSDVLLFEDPVLQAHGRLRLSEILHHRVGMLVEEEKAKGIPQDVILNNQDLEKIMIRVAGLRFAVAGDNDSLLASYAKLLLYPVFENRGEGRRWLLEIIESGNPILVSEAYILLAQAFSQLGNTAEAISNLREAAKCADPLIQYKINCVRAEQQTARIDKVAIAAQCGLTPFGSCLIKEMHLSEFYTSESNFSLPSSVPTVAGIPTIKVTTPTPQSSEIHLATGAAVEEENKNLGHNKGINKNNVPLPSWMKNFNSWKIAAATTASLGLATWLSSKSPLFGYMSTLIGVGAVGKIANSKIFPAGAAHYDWDQKMIMQKLKVTCAMLVSYVVLEKLFVNKKHSLISKVLRQTK